MKVVEASGLTMDYGDLRALHGIDLAVEEGEIVALLGPNGAGKTTTIEILEGYRSPTAGAARVLGTDPAARDPEALDRIGIMAQTTALEHQLTVTEILRYYGLPYRRPRRPEELLDLVGLADKAKATARSLSGGQQRRLELALALVGRPDLLFLDEPTTGFDPEARRATWELIDGLRAQGTTVLLTSHYLDEVEALADRVIVLVGGRIVAEGPPGALLADIERHREITFELDAAVALPRLPGAEVVRDDGSVAIRTTDLVVTLHQLTTWAKKQPFDLTGLDVRRPSLESVYLQIVQEVER